MNIKINAESITNSNKLNFVFSHLVSRSSRLGLLIQEMELNAEASDKKNNHSSSAASSLANELLLLDAADNELIINTNGLDNGIDGKLSADLSPNDLMMSSPRSTSPSDKEMDSPPRACIMRALSIVSRNFSWVLMKVKLIKLLRKLFSLAHLCS
jgi:hypothetical protein